MNKKLLALLATIVAWLATFSPARAQQPSKVASIGYLASGTLSAETERTEALRQGLRELGYTEGKNITIEWRFAEGKLDRYPALAAELVNLKVDVIVTAGGAATRTAKQATSTIPIVMAHRIPILLEADSSPVWRGRAETLLDCQRLHRS